MSQYTTQVRFLVEMNSDEGQSITNRCRQAAPNFFTNDWAFYDESKRLDFEADILRHFYTSEIGAETAELWKLFMNDWLIVNMPYYNAKLDALAKKFNWLDVNDYQESATFDKHTTDESNENQTGNSKTTTDSDSTTQDNGTGHNFQKVYDFPSSSIDDISDHMTSGNENDSTASNTSTNNSNSESNTNDSRNVDRTGNGTEHSTNVITRKGRMSSPSVELSKYLSAVQNVYRELFDNMSVLFFGLW